MPKRKSPELSPWYRVLGALLRNEKTPRELTREERSVRSGLGESLMHWLAVERHVDLVQQLIALGGKVDDVNESGRTALLECSMIGAKESVKVLLEGGANPNLQDDEGYTAMHFAAERRYQDLLDLMIQRGGDMSLADVNGKTPGELLEAALLRKKRY